MASLPVPEDTRLQQAQQQQQSLRQLAMQGMLHEKPAGGNNEPNGYQLPQYYAVPVHSMTKKRILDGVQRAFCLKQGGFCLRFAIHAHTFW